MRYNLSELARNGGSDTVRYKIENFSAYDDVEAGFRPVFPIDVTAEFKECGDTVLLTVSFEADVVSNCDRCLKEFTRRIVSKETYTVGDGDEAECVPATGGGVELDPLVWEALCLAIPYQNVCGDDCEGPAFKA